MANDGPFSSSSSSSSSSSPSSTPLNVIALISGGKDSFYSLLHCLALGHNVVALANLYPAPPAISTPSDTPPTTLTTITTMDLNSHMYQTAGHRLIPLYAHALSIPLYRAPISGSALNLAKEYSLLPFHLTNTTTTKDNIENNDDESDETESLLPLLRHVLAAHPAANALSSGAILSTYQRTRLESVCARIGLVPLAWLWQYPYLPFGSESDRDSGERGERGERGGGDTSGGGEGLLLEHIAAAGLEARIVKVASGGLDDGFLWGSLLAEEEEGKGGVRRRLERAVRRFGGSVLGEGGEFETLVVKGPRWGGWSGRIVVGDGDRTGERVVVRGEGGEAFLEFKGGTVVALSEDEDEDREGKSKVRMPELLDPDFSRLLSRQDFSDLRKSGKGRKEEADKGQKARTGTGMGEGTKGKGSLSPSSSSSWTARQVISRDGSTLKISNMTSRRRLHHEDNDDDGGKAQAQMSDICSHLKDILKARGLSADDLVFTTILLRSIADFAAVNAIYGALFNLPNPPARVTVACGELLPEGKDVVLSVVADCGTRAERRGLHVQSRSYWAPANIGPYSQAVSIGGDCGGNDDVEDGADGRVSSSSVVFVAGQIPLVPSSMTVLSPSEDDRQDHHDTFVRQALLSAQHLWRVGIEMGVDCWTGAVAFVVGEDDNDHDDCSRKAVIAGSLWRQLNELHNPSGPKQEGSGDISEEEESGPDLWDRTYGGMGSFAVESQEARRRPIPNLACLSPGTSPAASVMPGFFAVQVAETPRSCAIEWQSFGIASDSVKIDSDQASVTIKSGGRRVTFREFRKEIPLGHVEEYLKRAELWRKENEEKGQKAEDERDNGHDDGEVGDGEPETANRKSTVASHAVLYTPTPERFAAQAIAQIMPCRRIWGRNGKELSAGLVCWEDI